MIHPGLVRVGDTMEAVEATTVWEQTGMQGLQTETGIISRHTYIGWKKGLFL